MSQINETSPTEEIPSYDSFEEALPIIERLIRMRRHKWNLKAIPSIDYDDIAQILRLHIFNKFHLYDNSRPLAQWINTIITNQISNLLRNVYGNSARPCLQGCVFNQGNNLCGLTKSREQCSECPLYRKWEKSKKNHHDIRLALPICNHEQEVFDMPDESFDVISATAKFHKKMEQVLRPSEFRLYKLLYIECKTEIEISKILGYKSSEGRPAGYARIKQIKKIIMEKAQKVKQDIDLF